MTGDRKHGHEGEMVTLLAENRSIVVGKEGYEWKIVTLLALVWGCVMLDRMVIVFLFPMIVPEFHITNAQAGMLLSVLALTSGTAAWGLGSYSDRVGRKKVLIPACILFSLASWISGVARSFPVLLAARGIMGIGGGPCFSISAATISEESKPSRRGLNLGLHQGFSALIGTGVGAIMTTQLALYFGWRPVFFIVGVPGIVLAVLLSRIMREPSSVLNQTADGALSENVRPGILQPLRYRNVILSTLICCCFMTFLFVFSGFSTLFLTQVRGLDLGTAGLVVSAMGFGGLVGTILLPAVSDAVGRKSVLIAAAAGLGICVIAFTTLPLPAIPAFLVLFVASICGAGGFPIMISLIPSESVPVFIAGSAVGLVQAIGEIFGSVIMPPIAGKLADLYGLGYPLILAGALPLISSFIVLGVVETAPRIVGKKRLGNERLIAAGSSN